LHKAGRDTHGGDHDDRDDHGDMGSRCQLPVHSSSVQLEALFSGRE
jgi:hypothetical protein